MVFSTKTPSEDFQGTPTSNVQRKQQNIAEEHEGLDAWLQALGAFLVYIAT